MADKDKKDRFEKLKSMRSKLWEKEILRIENLKKQKWLIEQVNELKKISDCENCTVETIKNKINEIIGEFEASGDKNEQ
tara:strand:+ start:22 stop:258 length:237 start_codon:yes stop_codon:yes gene_type:complete